MNGGLGDQLEDVATRGQGIGENAQRFAGKGNPRRQAGGAHARTMPQRRAECSGFLDFLAIARSREVRSMR